jgi:hypothetical protein
MNIGFKIRNTETNEFLKLIFEGRTLESAATFPDEASALEYLKLRYEYGVSYEIVKVFYSYKSL